MEILAELIIGFKLFLPVFIPMAFVVVLFLFDKDIGIFS